MSFLLPDVDFTYTEYFLFFAEETNTREVYVLQPIVHTHVRVKNTQQVAFQLEASF
eukprot:COSAG05_NODE_2256_length_3329_cov_2.630031_3_plen_56_part_00